ncbi:MAG: ATP-binding cassette domain-containing protein [Clostridiales bacterium]|nr:ATP-binding cassette domain-containing protein [Clostridiales bacterium]
MEIKNLSHIFDAKPLFENANLSINNGEHIGIVGLNGAGKSTFMNIIAGILNQDSGEVRWTGNPRRGYLDQHADIDRSLTVMEYLKSGFAGLYELESKMESLYAEMSEPGADENALEQKINKANNILDTLTREGFFDLDATIRKVANGLGVNNLGYDTPVANLSGGGRAKLMLSKLLLEKPDVMLLDEPTNFLDAEHVAWLAEYLNGFEKTFMLISHDTDFLDKTCKFIVSIENGGIRKYGGNYSQYIVQAEQNAKQYGESYERQQREIERMEDYIARNKARAATAGMAASRQKMLDRMEIINKPSVIYDAEFSFPLIAVHTRDMLRVDNLKIGYGEPLLPPVSLRLSSEAKLWIRGTNGIGKTTLIKTLTGLLRPLGGGFAFHPAAAIGYLEQDLLIDEPNNNAVGYFCNLFPKMNIKNVRAALAKAGIKNTLATKAVSDLSGGEQVRIFLCALGQKQTNILLLDEPTNHLDVRAKAALKAALIAYGGCIVLVSHEKDFAADVCTDVFDVKA